ncbi:hypothetical protein FQN57_001696 [Myotisia sp. PD_48]|nr:hypothetical protein FQN57_001696 [Myotisia sp. PD_48]
MRRAASWIGTPSIKGQTESTRLALLTASFVGLHFAWAIEMSYCTPFVLELGLAKSRIAVVWIAGPLSALITQPLIGVVADRSKSKRGRRRPFMVGASISVGIWLLVLGWTKEIVALFARDETHVRPTFPLSIGSYVKKLAEEDRGNCPCSLEMVAMGHLIGCAIGSTHTHIIFGDALGGEHFKQMTVIAALSLISCVLITYYSVTERILVSTRDSHSKLRVGNLLGPILGVDRSTWVGGTSSRPEKPTSTTQKPEDTLHHAGHLGSLSLVIFALIALISSVLVPLGILTPEGRNSTLLSQVPRRIAKYISKVSFLRPDLQITWMISHLLFAASMVFAPFARSFAFATFLVEINRFATPLPMGDTTSTTTSAMYSSTRESYIPLHSRERSETNIIFDEHVLRLNHHHDEDDSESEIEDDENSQASTGEFSGLYLGVLSVFTAVPQILSMFICWVVFSILEPRQRPHSQGNAEQPSTIKDGGGVSSERVDLNTKSRAAIGACLFIGALSALVASEATRRLKFVR